jgi:hypothetical protein
MNLKFISALGGDIWKQSYGIGGLTRKMRNGESGNWNERQGQMPSANGGFEMRKQNEQFKRAIVHGVFGHTRNLEATFATGHGAVKYGKKISTQVNERESC